VFLLLLRLRFKPSFAFLFFFTNSVCEIACIKTRDSFFYYLLGFTLLCVSCSYVLLVNNSDRFSDVISKALETSEFPENIIISKENWAFQYDKETKGKISSVNGQIQDNINIYESDSYSLACFSSVTPKLSTCVLTLNLLKVRSSHSSKVTSYLQIMT
jgi:hypothetical protein